MKKYLLIGLAALVLFSFAGCGEREYGIEKGDKIEDLELYDLDGNLNFLYEHAGKTIMLNFWATWCPPCRAEMPSMESVYIKNKDNNFVILAVSNDDKGPEHVREFINRNGYSFPVFHDKNRKLSRKFNIRAIPTTYIIDKNGVIVDIIRGAKNWNNYKFPE